MAFFESKFFAFEENKINYFFVFQEDKNKKFYKKGLLIFISVLMISRLFPLTAFAEETEPEEGKKKGKIKLNDTVKFDSEKDTPETFFVKKPAGGNFYVGVLSAFEFDEMDVIVDGFLKAELIDFDPEKYQSIGETYRVYNLKTGEIAEGFEELEYEKAKEEAEKLNDENKVTFYEVACNQFVYVAKINVPKNYGVFFESGTYI